MRCQQDGESHQTNTASISLCNTDSFAWASVVIATCGTSGSSLPFWPVSRGTHASLCALIVFLASVPSFRLFLSGQLPCLSSTSYYYSSLLCRCFGASSLLPVLRICRSCHFLVQSPKIRSSSGLFGKSQQKFIGGKGPNLPLPNRPLLIQSMANMHLVRKPTLCAR